MVFRDGGGILPGGYQSGELSGRYRVNRLAPSSRGSNSMSVYDQDGLRSVPNHEFMTDPVSVGA